MKNISWVFFHVKTSWINAMESGLCMFNYPMEMYLRAGVTTIMLLFWFAVVKWWGAFDQQIYPWKRCFTTIKLDQISSWKIQRNPIFLLRNPRVIQRNSTRFLNYRNTFCYRCARLPLDPLDSLRVSKLVKRLIIQTCNKGFLREQLQICFSWPSKYLFCNVELFTKTPAVLLFEERCFISWKMFTNVRSH